MKKKLVLWKSNRRFIVAIRDYIERNSNITKFENFSANMISYLKIAQMGFVTGN